MNEHPVSYSVEYPDRPLNRLTTGLRIFTVIPIAILSARSSAIRISGPPATPQAAWRSAAPACWASRRS